MAVISYTGILELGGYPSYKHIEVYAVYICPKVCPTTCADPGIFVRKVQVSLTKKLCFFVVFFFFFFFSPQLILQKSNGQFQRNLSFFKVPEGVNIFQGGVQLFF